MGAASANKYLIIIAGPTAIGKTNLAIQVAQYFDTEILSADSRQIYRELNIGVAKPSKAELKRAKHHFIGHTSIAEIYSVGRYERDAIAIINRLFLSKDMLICTGGTGLYINALRYGLDEFPPTSPKIKAGYEDLLAREGIEALQQLLKVKDPTYYNDVDINNPARIVRALAVCDSSNQPYSTFLKSQNTIRPFTIIPILLTRDRSELYNRINCRVDLMIREGLEAEVKELYPYRHLPTLRTVGYQELWPFFEGKIQLEEAVLKLKQKTRNYAKRQLTWFRKHGPWVDVPATISTRKLIDIISIQIQISNKYSA